MLLHFPGDSFSSRYCWWCLDGCDLGVWFVMMLAGLFVCFSVLGCVCLLFGFTSCWTLCVAVLFTVLGLGLWLFVLALLITWFIAVGGA